MGGTVIYSRRLRFHDIPVAALDAHLAVDQAYVADVRDGVGRVKSLDFREWYRIADAYESYIMVHPSLDPGSAPAYGLQYDRCVGYMMEAARNGQYIAFDLESHERPDETLATLGVRFEDTYIVVIEPSPFLTLQNVLHHHPSLLVWGGDEIQWLHNRTWTLQPTASAVAYARMHGSFRDLQRELLRDDAFLANGYWDQRRRTLQEGFALFRDHEAFPIYVKETDGDVFFFPNGPQQPSIWARRPLLINDVKYAGSDVIALLVMADAV